MTSVSPADVAQAAARARLASTMADYRAELEKVEQARQAVREAAAAAAGVHVPITEIARIARVTRHTVYGWLGTLLLV